MSASEPRPEKLLRDIPGDGHHRVTSVELFFDLVFVFAVTQISHTMIANFTPLGLLQTSLLFAAVWWVWIYTSWTTNWLNPDEAPVRLLLFAMMLGGLVLSTSIPKAFDGRGLWFAIAYAGMQVGRTLFLVWSLQGSDRRPLWLNAWRIAVWLSTSGVLWIAGGLSDGEMRLWLWGTALIIEYVSPSVRFWVPRLGASQVEDWIVEGGHVAERCGLFIIIALGESILVTGATFAEAVWTPSTITAFVLSFVTSLAMWWIYFHKGADAGSQRISQTSDPGRMARLAYTYLHMPIVAGIIVSAVADELVLHHPDGLADGKMVLSLIGGPLLFLVGTTLFKRTIHGWLQLSHMAGIGALLVLAPFGHLLSPVALAGLTTTIVVIVAIWEAVSLRDKATMDLKESIEAN